MNILIVINDGHFFLSHRLGLAKGAQQNGYNVIVACPNSDATQKIIDEGFTHFPIVLNRKSLNPFGGLKLIHDLYTLYKKIQPDIIHHFTSKPIIFGSIAAQRLKKSIVINAPTGLGYIFTNVTLKAKILRPLVIKLYQFALRKPNTTLIFQNPDDKKESARLKLSKNKTTYVIKGAGVEPDFYIPKAESVEKSIAIFPARLLWDKGIGEFVEAARIIRLQEIPVRLVLVGDIDPGNPATISQVQLQSWIDEGVIEWWGWKKNMVEVFHQSHIVCLPSYREGIPKVLLEAAACKKPIITTDAPGCREVVIDKHNGFLVPVKNAALLAERIITLVNDKNLRELMGERGREKVLAEFATSLIVEETLNVYANLLKYK